jgi:PAS domain S-box-containing protein
LEIGSSKNPNNNNSKAARISRGKQAEIPLNTAIIGGGKACYSLLKLLDGDRLQRLNMKILGVMDVNPEAPGLILARKLHLFTTNNIHELFDLEGLNLIIELTGSAAVRQELALKKPQDISVIDHLAARLLWDLIQVELERTELERERQRLWERERTNTQIILDSLPYRIMVVNTDLTVDSVNQTFLNDFKLDLDEIIGKHCYEVRYGLEESCDKCGRVCYLKDYYDEIKEKKLFSTIKEFRDEKNEERFDIITIAPILNEEGEIVKILEASRDVTERSRLEKEVERSKTFLEKVIQSTVDGIVVVDTKGNVRIFNEGMERLTGYDREEVSHLISFYDIDVAKENMKKMRSSEYGPLGKLKPTSMTITTKEGESIPVTLSASIVTIDGKEIGSVGVFTDMREILQMREELEKAHIKLVQAEKIASVGRMAAGVAHEINNPLSGIMIYAELLKDALKNDAEKQKDVQEIIDQTLRCKKIVAELLEFSRQSVGNVSSFSLKEIIGKSLSLLIHQALFQDIEVKTKIEPDMPDIVGDIGQLQQVFTNLFINSADAMGGKGRLTIQARFVPDRNIFDIRVSDTGPGIPEHLREKIFDIFFTTKSVGKGTGLGLSISQNIIELHGGTISVDCPPEGGSTFLIQLPLGFVERPVEEPLFVGLEE